MSEQIKSSALDSGSAIDAPAEERQLVYHAGVAYVALRSPVDDRLRWCRVVSEPDEAQPQRKGFGSLLCDVRYRLLEVASKALDAGAYGLVCDMLAAYDKVK